MRVGNRWVYFFGPDGAEGEPDRKDVLGGKGAGLAAMTRAGLPVPPGFTIATECCRRFLESGGVWPEGLEDEVRRNLARLEEAAGRRFGDAARPLLVSVRSGAAVSMPGMMDTILNCGLSAEAAAAGGPAARRVYLEFIRAFAGTVAGIPAEAFAALAAPGGAGGPAPVPDSNLAERYLELYEQRAGRPFPARPWDALVQCIDAVFRSWQSARAVTYRREHDVRGCAGTAVNVQAMFPSEVSGIVFTINPNDLNADEMVMESAYGLGESVVSGDVDPDRFIVDRRDLSVKRTAVGHKAHVAAALGAPGQRDPDAPSLDEARVLELARLALGVEKFFGRPMDIEWGWAEGRFALLQARPIRGLDVAEDVEIGRQEEALRLRELAAGRRKVWVLHNLGETLPWPTPLTWDVIRRFMSGDGGLGRMYRDFGYRPSPEVCREGFLELVCGRIYADPDRAADLFWGGMPFAYDLAEVAANPKALESAPTRFDPDRAGGRFFLRLPGLVAAMVRASRRLKGLRAGAARRFRDEVLPPYLAWVAERRGRDLAALSTAEVLAELEARIARVLDDFGAESLKPGFFGGLALASLEARLCQLMGREAGTALCLTLTQGLDGDTTVEQNVSLCRAARGEMSLDAFLDRFGHRAVGEMELARPRWREDDSYVRQILAVYGDASASSPEAMHEANVRRRLEARAALADDLRRWGGSSFREEVEADLRDAWDLLPYREAGKHYLMMGYEVIRGAAVELARRWDLGRDLFFLRLGELARWEADRERLAALAAARKVRWQSARRIDMPEVIDSDRLDAFGLAPRAPGGSDLACEPIASGVVTGVARVVFDPQQAAGALTDYILVCPSTDPGWTALFVHARGLVVEQGGMLSHGAIVARDFGIPAVVCPGATRSIPDGRTIRLDGNAGRITLLEEA